MVALLFCGGKIMIRKIKRINVDKRDKSVRLTQEAQRQQGESQIEEIYKYLDYLADEINKINS